MNTQEVRELVEQYRRSSRRWRDLGEDHFGQKNVDASSRHTRSMAQAYVRLQQLGRDDLARLLEQWHGLLRGAPYQLSSVAKRMRGQAVQLALQINEAVKKASDQCPS